MTAELEESYFFWDEIEKISPATVYQTDHNYIFLPIPRQEQTFKQAYDITRGLGPALKILKHIDKRWAGLQLPNACNLAIFTRLYFLETTIIASTCPGKHLSEKQLNIIGIALPYVIEIFQKFFFIISPQQYATSFRKQKIQKISLN